MTSAGFEPVISAIEPLQDQILDRIATGAGQIMLILVIIVHAVIYMSYSLFLCIYLFMIYLTTLPVTQTI